MLRPIDQIPGVQRLTPPVFPDERGFLLEAYVESKLDASGIPGRFRQGIQSQSRRGVVRGLHFQWEPPLGKLVRCVSGAIYDVLVDLRRGSPSFGDHVAVELSGDNHSMLWVPSGLAHGFMALADETIVFYFFTAEWAPVGEGAIRWDDPALGIRWPDLPAIVSARDRHAPTFEEWRCDPRSSCIRYEESDTNLSLFPRRPGR